MATTAAATAAAYGASTVELGSDVKAAGAGPDSSPSTSSSSFSLLGTRCGSPNSARSPEKQGSAASTPRGDAVRRYLRSLTRKLQRGAGSDDERPDGLRNRRKRRWKTMPEGRAAAVVDGTTQEREEAVVRALAYCKETTTRQRGTSPPLPSPSLDGCLIDRPEDEIGRCPALRRDVSLLEWLPEAPACTSSAAVPRHRSCAASDECGGKSVSAKTGKRASRRDPAWELGMRDIFDGLDMDALDGTVRIMNYLSAKYEQGNIEELLD